jgi:hypothetical protein
LRLPERHRHVDRLAKAFNDRLQVASADESHGQNAIACFSAPGHERWRRRCANRKVREVAFQKLGDLGSWRVEEGQRVLTEQISLRSREYQLVQIEGLSLLGYQTGEREASVISERTRLEPNESSIDEFSGLACAGDELSIAIALSPDLGDYPVTSTPHFLLEAPRFRFAPVLAHNRAQTGDRECRHEAKRQDESGR